MICQHFKNLSSDKIFSSRQCYSHRYENYFYFIFIWWNLVLGSQQCLPLSLALLSPKPKLLNRKKQFLMNEEVDSPTAAPFVWCFFRSAENPKWSQAKVCGRRRRVTWNRFSSWFEPLSIENFGLKIASRLTRSQNLNSSESDFT